ncbi:hypothetical protein GCM10011332_31360 [Terasakiella brassicae]|uniref:Uncharacterized protein n=1 Tax=Terasakiella brassicae TaxID=1634917 RepID=A0A917C8M3_9PROT|nr:hypothetical protein [Terasakiella brassicae]GGF75045.1 hypothetical protein GCM10011332_31360 [Terasakiella brassicae]
MIELNFSNKQKPMAVVKRNDPVKVFRAALAQQLNVVAQELNGKTLTIERRRYHHGKPTTIAVPVRKWYWADDGEYYLILRYSSQKVKIRGYESIRCGATLGHVQATLNRVVEALDDQDEDVLVALDDAFERTRWKKFTNIQS